MEIEEAVIPVTLRMPRKLHEAIRNESIRLNVSMQQLILKHIASDMKFKLPDRRWYRIDPTRP
jgi:hypothetical protein